MGELLSFSDRKKKLVENTHHSVQPSEEGFNLNDLLASVIEIPSAEALYNESQILFNGHSVTDSFSDGPEGENSHAMQAMLYAARFKYIRENVVEAKRKHAIRELYEYTWTRAKELEDDDLRSRIERRIGDSFGMHDGGRILEGLYMKWKIYENHEQQASAEESHMSDIVPSEPSLPEETLPQGGTIIQFRQRRR